MWHSFFSNFQGDGARRFPFFGGGDAVSLAPEVREWKSVSGEPIHISATRRLVGNLVLDGDSDPETVRVQVGAKCYRLPISELSVADREYIKTERAKKRKTPTAPDWLVEEKSAQARVDDALKMVDDFSKAVKEKYGVIRERALPEIKSRFGVLRGKFCKSPRVVATVAELYDAVENAVDGETIALKDGTYRLSESIVVQGKKLTLIGESGERTRVKVMITGAPTLAVGDDVELTLTDLTFVSGKGMTIALYGKRNGVVKATRCNFKAGSGAPTVWASGGVWFLKECNIVGAIDNEAKGKRAAIDIGDGATLTAEDCDFKGNIWGWAVFAASLKNCLIHDCGQQFGVSINGTAIDEARCEFIDCQIVDAEWGINGYKAQIIMRGGLIRNITHTAVRIRNGVLKLNDVNFSSCRGGVCVDGEKSVCEAVNLMFTNVDFKWSFLPGASATLDGKRITDDDEAAFVG